ncbi:MAG: LysM peptidoglycan-binding domain-containing protein, partial [Prevotella sp.]|nr:LysM peptidoglycan-binding domain-containing protein [Prevotella sp.]
MKLIKCFFILVLLITCTASYSQSTNIRTQHKVEKNESVFGIAKKYGVTLEELIDANPKMKQPGYELNRGTMLSIPYGKNQTPPSSSKDNTAKPATTQVTGKKEVKVGVMLPLHDNDGDGRRMVEYYRGLLLGADR